MRKAEMEVRKEGNKMLEATKDAKDLNPMQKSDTMQSIRKQVRDVVDEIHGRKRGFTPQ